MQRELERRLQALETNWFGSPEDAAQYRATRAMSDEELRSALYERFQHFSDAEWDQVMKNIDRANRVQKLLDATE